jgi:enoyl-CoA hydratase/carnithine racemase
METLQGLDAALDQLQADDALKGMILTGTGRTFCEDLTSIRLHPLPTAKILLNGFNTKKVFC